MTTKNPIQPIIKDDTGRLRFKRNAIVDFLLEFSTSKGISLNELSSMDFSKDDWQQLAQLIGYSLSGYSELRYVDNESYYAAVKMHEDKLSEKDARIQFLENLVNELKSALREPMAKLFEKHPDDF